MIKHQITSYIRYWLYAVDQHSLHAPFLYDFYTTVILPSRNSEKHQKEFIEIEGIRQQFLRDEHDIQLEGLGAGSKHFESKTRQVQAIAKTSLTSPKFARLYNSIIRYCNSKNIVELGTSLGINTAYLANTTGVKVSTFEGEKQIAAVARKTFEHLQLNNITLIEGDIDKTLPAFVSDQKTIDFAFLDANHGLAPTLTYFETISKKIHAKSVVIIDDIHQSAAMEEAWQTIRAHGLVYCSIDLFRCGIVFFDPSLHKQHVVLQF